MKRVLRGLVGASAGRSRFEFYPVGFGACLVWACNHPLGSTTSLERASNAAPLNAGEHDVRQGTGGSVPTNVPVDAATVDARLPRTASPVASTLVDAGPLAPKSPSIVFHEQASTATEFELEATGFPAISRDGKLVALAFHELKVAGPPALELGVQLRSVASGAIVYNTKFREPYQGELGAAYLEPLKHRVRRWVLAVERKLAEVNLAPMNPVVHDESAVCSDERPPIRVPAVRLDVRFSAGHLVVSDDKARVLFEHAHPEWTATYGSAKNRCVFEPYVTEVAFDAPRNVLVIRADHCTPSDLCEKGIVPNFAVLTLGPRLSE